VLFDELCSNHILTTELVPGIILLQLFLPCRMGIFMNVPLFFPSLSGAGSMTGFVTSGPGHFQSHRHTGAQCYTEKAFTFWFVTYIFVYFLLDPQLSQTASSTSARVVFAERKDMLYMSTPLITCSRVNNASVFHSRGANQLLQ